MTVRRIYASPFGGRRYHSTWTCVGLNSTMSAQCWSATVPTISRAEAIKRGLTPYRVCSPPRLLSVVPGGVS